MSRPHALKNCCGLCGGRIKWGTDINGYPTPKNPDDTLHLLSCSFVTERRKREIKEEATSGLQVADS